MGASFGEVMAALGTAVTAPFVITATGIYMVLKPSEAGAGSDVVPENPLGASTGSPNIDPDDFDPDDPNKGKDNKNNWDSANFRDEELDIHFEKHANEWESIAKEDYLNTARNLLNSEVDGNIVGFTRSSGDIVRYNTATNELAIGSRDGVIRTLFRPEKGMDYYLSLK